MRYSNHGRAANGFYGWFGWLQTNSSKSPAFCKCGLTGVKTEPLSAISNNNNSKVEGIEFTLAFKHNMNARIALQNILKTTAGYNFIAQFMKANEKITLITNNEKTETIFSANGVRSNDKLILNAVDLDFTVDVATGEVIRRYGITRTLEKNNLKPIGDNLNYNLNNGVAFLVELTTDVPVGSEQAASVMSHEFFVHVQKDIDRIINSNPYAIGSSQYQRILTCIGNSANSDHGQFARGEISQYNNISTQLDQLFNTNRVCS